MIPVALPRSKSKYATPTFACFHCNGLFRKRHATAKKRFCVDCEDLVSRARDLVSGRIQYAVKTGKMRPATDFDCADCGKKADRYDHRDYSKPYQVEPVCCSCNNRRGPAVLGL